MNKKCFGLLVIKKSQGQTTLQDLGRKGWQHLGICQSGASDEHAFLWGNKLLRNYANSPALEITFGQFSCEFTADTFISVTGASAALTINNIPKSLWQTHRVRAGETLTLSVPKTGVINYLCVKEGFIAKPQCGSYSQCAREAIGPFNGQPLIPNSYVGYRSVSHNPLSLPKSTQTQTPTKEVQAIASCTLKHKRFINAALRPQDIPDYSKPLALTLYPSADPVLSKAANLLLNCSFVIDQNSNKMGYRLNAMSLALKHYAGGLSDKTVSAGTVLGTVQLPPNGDPIILLKDRQTMGGYPVLGCISSLSAYKLAQKRPGQAVTFNIANREQHVQNAINLQVFFDFFKS